jgi:helix-turn-helix protein
LFILGAYTNFGHHNTGVAISKVFPHNTEAILFYFRKLNTLSVLGYQKLQKEKEKQRSEARKLWEKEHLANLAAYKKQSIEDALSIFK